MEELKKEIEFYKNQRKFLFKRLTLHGIYGLQINKEDLRELEDKQIKELEKIDDKIKTLEIKMKEFKELTEKRTLLYKALQLGHDCFIIKSLIELDMKIRKIELSIEENKDPYEIR